MYYLKLVFKNIFRHKLRSLLTLFGLVTVLNKDKISLRVAPEVSDLDFSNAIRVEGYFVPGLKVRRTSTTVELGDGQSFAIAGLLRENVRTVISKYPVLGNIPILGVLFQSKEFQKENTELIIIVTPHLVKPLDMAKQTLPTVSMLSRTTLSST